MPTDLSILTCGRSAVAPGGGDSELGEILAYIQTSLESVLNQLSWLSLQEPARVSMLAPFLGRSLLELSTTALIGRLDPLRLLVVRQIQAQPDYNTAVPWKASIRWQGDVLVKKEKELWSQALEYEKVTKALLGEYYDHLMWRPAFIRMLSCRPAGGGTWLAELAGINAESFILRRRDEIGRLYSSLSKGIHHEFVMPPGSVYDQATITELLRRSVHVVADLALVSHFIPHSAATLPPQEALEAFNRIENMEVMR